MIGAGTDIVSVARMASLVQTGGDRFLQRWFTGAEIDYCTSMARPELHFAARMAAKEAVVKALHGPGDGPVPYASIEITRGDDGVPGVALSGDVLAHAQSRGVGPIHVSMSHCDEYAVAVAHAEAAPAA